MNLIFRMLYVFVLSWFREPLGFGKPVSRLSLRVLPNDLDINFHMNNGRYLTICDLNRVDLFIRTGLLKAMSKRGWIPVIAEHTMTYKKPLGLFEQYDVQLEVTHSDDKYFYMAHTFNKTPYLSPILGTLSRRTASLWRKAHRKDAFTPAGLGWSAPLLREMR